jgi:hypothetical protein
MKKYSNGLIKLNASIFSAIVLLLIINSAVASPFNYKAYRAENAPVIDGIGNEECWSYAKWESINQPFDGQVLPDSSDFYGRYKIVWTSSRLYVLMEITDDKLVDNRINPSDNYWEDDLTEFFIDEDHTSQGHECGVDAFNALAYHIAAVARDKNNYANGNIVSLDSPDGINHVIDLGSDCNTGRALNLDDHVNAKIAKNGNKYTWELEFKIFDKTYNQNNKTNIPVNLTPKKVMGFAIAYCDDDSGKRDNMIGTIPNHNDYSGKYPFYRFTNEFGTLTLNDSVLISAAIPFHETGTFESKFWPNPVENTLHISNNNHSINMIRINNMAGQVLISQSVTKKTETIDVSKLHSGTYILELNTSEEKIQRLFIKN